LEVASEVRGRNKAVNGTTELWIPTLVVWLKRGSGRVTINGAIVGKSGDPSSVPNIVIPLHPGDPVKTGIAELF